MTQFLAGLGDDVQVKELKFYVAFKRLKNFACLELYPQAGTVMAYLKLDPAKFQLEEGFTRDVKKIGHFGTGDLEVAMRSPEDFTRAMPLLQRAYDGGYSGLIAKDKKKGRPRYNPWPPLLLSWA